MIGSTVRRIDVPSWWMSDIASGSSDAEIITLLPETPKEKACLIAQQLHKAIKDTAWLAPSPDRPLLSASIGVATFPEDGDNSKEVLAHMYDALSLVQNSRRDGVAASKLGVLGTP